MVDADCEHSKTAPTGSSEGTSSASRMSNLTSISEALSHPDAQEARTMVHQLFSALSAGQPVVSFGIFESDLKEAVNIAKAVATDAQTALDPESFEIGALKAWQEIWTLTKPQNTRAI